MQQKNQTKHIKSIITKNTINKHFLEDTTITTFSVGSVKKLVDYHVIGHYNYVTIGWVKIATHCFFYKNNACFDFLHVYISNGEDESWVLKRYVLST